MRGTALNQAREKGRIRKGKTMETREGKEFNTASRGEDRERKARQKERIKKGRTKG